MGETYSNFKIPTTTQIYDPAKEFSLAASYDDFSYKPQDYRMNAGNGVLMGDQNYPKAPESLNGFQNFGLAAQGLGSLYGMYNAHQMRKQGKKQFGIELAGMNRSLANNATSYNADLMERTRNGLALNSVEAGSQEYIDRMARAKAANVDGSAIG